MTKTKKMVMKVEELGSTFAFIILILFFVMSAFETYEFLQKPEDYVNVYHLDITKDNWKWDYLQNNTTIAIISISGICFYCLSYSMKENRTLITLRSIFTLILFGSLFYGYYQWYLTGFDH